MAIGRQRNQPIYPKLAYNRNAPDQVKAIMGKLTRDPDQPRGKTAENPHLNVSRDLFTKLSKSTAQDTADADNVFQLLPDVELAEQILVGSILSPKDMTHVELGFKVEEGLFDSEVARSMLEVIETHFKQDYKIDEQLDRMLEEILFTKGAYIQAVLPENNLDRIINGQSRLSVEHYKQAVTRIQKSLPLGFLGHPREARVSMESFRGRDRGVESIQGSVATRRGEKSVTLPHVAVSDNFDLLKTPEIQKRGRANAIGSLLGRHTASMESASKGMTPEQIDALYDRPRGQAQQLHTVIPQEYMDRPSVGHPLVMKLPVESVIPVFPPGQPEEHVGYFVMIDQNGRPVVRDDQKDYYGELRTSFRGNQQDNTSELVRQTREAMGGIGASEDLDVDGVQQAYSTIVENDLINRLRNGIYQEEFSLGSTEELYRIMLHRSLKGQRTQLLYIPAELMTYMAFDFNKFGIGQTLLTKSKILSSMRSVLLFAETMSGVRNAVGRKKANINVDPDDPDPQKTISDIQNAILEGSKRGFPLASPDPAQTLDFLNRAGFDFSINVESDNYPTTKVDFDDYNTNVNGGNPELQDRLRRMQISSWGMNPELVDPTQSPDFATSVVNNNLIMTRRVLRYQKRFTAFLTQFIQTYVLHSSTLLDKLREELKGNKQKLITEHKKLSDDEVIEAFVAAVTATLPAPDTTRTDQQLQAFEQYSNLLDRSLEAYITPDLFPAEMLEREPDTVNHVISVVRAYYQRLWLEQNNVMPQLGQLTEMDGRKPGFSLLDIQQAQFKSVGNAIQKYMEGIEKSKEKWAEKYGEKVEEEEAASGFGDDATTDEFGDGDEGGDDFGEEASDADDDFGEETDDFGEESEEEGELEEESEETEEEEESDDDSEDETK